MAAKKEEAQQAVGDYPYPDFSHAAAQWPIAKKLLNREPLDEPAKDIAKAFYVLSGVGLSYYPGAPETFGAETYSAADAIEELEAVFGQDKFAGSGLLPNLPWRFIVPLLIEAFMAWLRKQ